MPSRLRESQAVYGKPKLKRETLGGISAPGCLSKLRSSSRPSSGASVVERSTLEGRFFHTLGLGAE